MGIGQHACPQVGVLGLGPIIVCEDVTQRAPLGGTNQSAALAGVAHKEVEFPLVCHQPPSQPFSVSLLPWVNLPMTEQAWSLLLGNQSSVCFSKEMIASLTLRDFRRPELCEEGKELCRGPTTA